MNSLEKHIEERTHSLQKSLSLIRATIESSTDGIVVIDESNTIMNHNTRFTDMWEINISIVGQDYNEICQSYICPKLITPAVPHELNDDYKTSPQMNKNYLELINKKIYERHAQPCKLEDETIALVWSFRDVTEAVSSREKIEYQATHDKLTGLPNRTLFFDRLNQNITMAKRNNAILGVLFFDLNRFKIVNDSLGHKTGDEVLKKFF